MFFVAIASLFQVHSLLY